VRSLTRWLALSLLLGYLNFRSCGGAASCCCLLSRWCIWATSPGFSVDRVCGQWGGQAWRTRTHRDGLGVFAIVLGGALGAVAAMHAGGPSAGCRSGASDNGEKSNRRPDASERRPYLVAAGVVALAVGEIVFLHHLTTLPPRGAAGVVLAADEINPVEAAGVSRDRVDRTASWPVSAIEREILPPTRASRGRFISAIAIHRRWFCFRLS